MDTEDRVQAQLNKGDEIIAQLTKELQMIDSNIIIERQRLEAIKEKMVRIHELEEDIQYSGVVEYNLRLERIDFTKEIDKRFSKA